MFHEIADLSGNAVFVIKLYCDRVLWCSNYGDKVKSIMLHKRA